jgi:hypothetical protein
MPKLAFRGNGAAEDMKSRIDRWSRRDTMPSPHWRNLPYFTQVLYWGPALPKTRESWLRRTGTKPEGTRVPTSQDDIIETARLQARLS